MPFAADVQAARRHETTQVYRDITLAVDGRRIRPFASGKEARAAIPDGPKSGPSAYLSRSVPNLS